MTADLLTRGTTTRSATDIARQIESRLARDQLGRWRGFIGGFANDSLGSRK